MKIYYGKMYDTSNHTSDEFFHVNSSGMTYLKNYDRGEIFKLSRPEGCVDFYIVVIVKCMAEAVVGSKNYRLKEND